MTYILYFDLILVDIRPDFLSGIELTHSSKAIALGEDGDRNGRDENGEFSTKNDLLEVGEHISECGTWNLGYKCTVRFLP